MAPDTAPPPGQDSKTQLLERLKAATNVLVTVSNNPSVDQLAAAIGLTLMLNKMDKHASAVFSGAVPSTIEFLQPEKTLEKTTDSLRDFIIALDKSKADKLRYKVEDKVVKIFITPYRSSLSEKDLQFSQGDFNVDVVLALGVHQQADLDVAITSHGRILHDATVISINNRQGGDLGKIHWLEAGASSLSEMLASIADELKPNVLDEQISTALLTGIVAETDRFRNERTTPQTMSVSGKLMTTGANQQLIASKLDAIETIPQQSTPLQPPAASALPPLPTPPPPKKDDGALDIAHEEPAKPAEPTKQEEKPAADVKPAEKKPAEAKPASDGALDYNLHETAGSTIHINEDGDLLDIPLPPSQSPNPHMILQPPSMGGALNATYKNDGGGSTTDPLSLPPVDEPAPGLANVKAPTLPNDLNDETLAEIEETVHSPHLQQMPQPPEPPQPVLPPPPQVSPLPPPPAITNISPPPADPLPTSPADYFKPPAPEADVVPPPLETARNAVEDAVASAPPPLEPIVALNSQPLGQDLRIPDLPPAPMPPTPPAAPGAWPSFMPPDNGLGVAPSDSAAPPSPPPPLPPPFPPSFNATGQ